MRYVREAVAPCAIQRMNQLLSNCKSCPIHCGTRTLGTGDPNASLLIIMDYPTAQQASYNRPISIFEGNEKVEAFLRATFEKEQVDFSKLFFMNTVNCCPSRTVKTATGKEELYRTPLPNEIRACETYVKYAVDVLHPPMIILMGAVASNVYIKKQAISKIRGTWHSVHCIPAMLTYSPNEIQDYRQVSVEKARLMLQEFQNDIHNALEQYRRMWPNSELFSQPKN